MFSKKEIFWGFGWKRTECGDLFGEELLSALNLYLYASVSSVRSGRTGLSAAGWGHMCLSISIGLFMLQYAALFLQNGLCISS